jgi:hypothetical protein
MRFQSQSHLPRWSSRPLRPGSWRGACVCSTHGFRRSTVVKEKRHGRSGLNSVVGQHSKNCRFGRHFKVSRIGARKFCMPFSRMTWRCFRHQMLLRVEQPLSVAKSLSSGIGAPGRAKKSWGASAEVQDTCVSTVLPSPIVARPRDALPDKGN